MINTDSPVGLVHPTPDPDLKTALSLELLEIANLKVAKMQKKANCFCFSDFPLSPSVLPRHSATQEGPLHGHFDDELNEFLTLISACNELKQSIITNQFTINFYK